MHGISELWDLGLFLPQEPGRRQFSKTKKRGRRARAHQGCGKPKPQRLPFPTPTWPALRGTASTAASPLATGFPGSTELQLIGGYFPQHVSVPRAVFGFIFLFDFLKDPLRGAWESRDPERGGVKRLVRSHPASMWPGWDSDCHPTRPGYTADGLFPGRPSLGADPRQWVLLLHPHFADEKTEGPKVQMPWPESMASRCGAWIGTSSLSELSLSSEPLVQSSANPDGPPLAFPWNSHTCRFPDSTPDLTFSLCRLRVGLKTLHFFNNTTRHLGSSALNEAAPKI